MEKRKKLLIEMLVAIAIVATIGFLGTPVEDTREGIWLPPNAVIANELEEDVYVGLSEVDISGTATTMSLQDYKENCNNFDENKVVILNSLRTYYIGKNNGLTYVATDGYYEKFNLFIKNKEDFSVVDREEGELTAKAPYGTRWSTIIIFIAICLILEYLFILILKDKYNFS